MKRLKVKEILNPLDVDLRGRPNGITALSNTRYYSMAHWTFVEHYIIHRQFRWINPFILWRWYEI